MDNKHCWRFLLWIVSILFCSGYMATAGTAYADIAESWPYVIGVGVTDSDYAMANSHTAYATVTVASPSGRSVTSSGNALGSVTVFAYINLAGESGTFSVLNDAREFCPAVGVSFSDGQASTATVIDPYVYVDKVTFSPPGVQRADSLSNFSVAVVRSTTCTSATVSVFAGAYSMTPQLVISYPEPHTGSGTFSPLGSATVVFRIGSAASNTTGGTITASGGIDSAGTCKMNGSPKSAELTVQ